MLFLVNAPCKSHHGDIKEHTSLQYPLSDRDPLCVAFLRSNKDLSVPEEVGYPQEGCLGNTSLEQCVQDTSMSDGVISLLDI